ncbi:hypothetical protein FT643_04655 [Ketobacter sp. MCCC 1A13808]|uniref:hypothetical protein n=1 Tax=Ketobacter sp. MCCC 1A13808 TaxID=2602738 RepID=UPI0012EBE2CC|nr:hypothetical protein [Ketobacter sp. MCCC 1A13808]MVF11430.1 hypothetical protein [Ketobacter sp. MCCC 1A13808]
MMSSLAKWIMSGPFQALAAAVALAMVPGLGWTSGAVIALVALRKSISDAAVPFLGAAAVAVMVHWPAGDVSQLGLVLAAVVAAVVLAGTRSLAWAVIAAGVVSALYMLSIQSLAAAKVDHLVTLFQPSFDAFEAELKKTGNEAMLELVTVRSVVVEGMAWVTTLGAIASLLLARWLQARLYNPGGFRAEFHQLRLTPMAAAGLMLVLILVQAKPEARMVLPCAVMPLLLASLGLVHGLFGRKPNSLPLLVFFYVGLLVSAGLGVMLLISAAVMDSFVDFRKRIQKRYE